MAEQRVDPMTYLPGMEILEDSPIQDEVLREYFAYTGKSTVVD